MISLKSFLKTIQTAILSADDVLKEKHQDLFHTYFEKDADDAEIQKHINQTIEHADEILDEAESNTVSKQSLENIKDALNDLKKSITQPDAIAQALAEGDLRPKTVVLNYPTVNKEGTVTDKEVHVPLITMIPITFSKIDELRLKANLELNVIDDEIQVGLGKLSSQTSENNDQGNGTPGNKHSMGSIEIIMKPEPMSDGLQLVVDAYEQTLKAQLPH